MHPASKRPVKNKNNTLIKKVAAKSLTSVGLKAQLYAASGIYMGQQRRNGIHLALTGQLSLYPFLGICQ